MNKPPLRKLFALQTGFCLVLGVIAGLLASSLQMLSAILGGVTIILANAWYLWRLFRISPGEETGRVLGNFHRAETGKFCLVALLITFFLWAGSRNEYELIPLIDSTALLVGFALTSLVVTLSNSWLFVTWFHGETGKSLNKDAK